MCYLLGCTAKVCCAPQAGTQQNVKKIKRSYRSCWLPRRCPSSRHVASCCRRRRLLAIIGGGGRTYAAGGGGCRSPRTSVDGGDRPSVRPCGREKRGVQSFFPRREVEGVTGRRDLPFAWWLEPPPCSSSAPPQPCTSFTIDETTGTTRKEGRVRR